MANIYISSTLADFRPEREAARDAILRLDHQPLDSYVARERRALDACLADVGLCQAYVGILGWRYGSLAKPHDRSYTELEYQQAGALNIPRLMFLLRQDAPIEPGWVDDDKTRILRFRQRVQENHIALEFSDHNELIVAVERAVRRTLGAGEPVPRELPWSADRGEQHEIFEDAVEGWVEEPLRPLVCVVHGGDYQGVERFLDRLSDSLAELVPSGGEEAPVKSYPLQWPRSFKSADDLKAKLHRYLSRAVLDQRAAAGEVKQALARHPGLVAVKTVLLTQDWKADGSAILDGFLDFWRELGAFQAERKVVAFLCFKYQADEGYKVRKFLRFFEKKVSYEALNREIFEHLESLAEASEARPDLVVLPRLRGVTRSEAEEWARRDATRDFCGGRSLVSDMRSLFERRARDRGGELRIPMEELAEALRNLLYQHNHAKEGSA